MSVKQTTWTEKYRPVTLDEIQGHDAIKRSMRHWIKEGDMPNTLLSGVPGVGKTALIHSYAKELYGKDFRHNFVEFNSSDDRSINVVRGPIKEEAQYGPKGMHRWKILYLGEMDGMTHAAQDALKRTMEVSHRNVRFMADCNNPEELIPAIQSRFCHFYVHPATEEDVLARLQYICREEELVISDEALMYIVKTVRGDMRNATALLQGLPFDDVPLTMEFIRELAPTPSHEHVAELIKTNWSADTELVHRKREEILQKLFRDDPSGRRILEIMYDGFEKTIEDSSKWRYLSIVADYEVRIHQGNPVHQIRCMLEHIRDAAGIA